MNVNHYLERIKYSGDLEASLKTLTLLHQSHLRTVPFENLDIPLSRNIELSLPKIYQKVVNERRGGFCYELNSLFCWLLRELGFEVSMLSAQVFDGEAFGSKFDHLFLLVHFADQQVLADVGFGDSYDDPLIFDESVQTQASRTYQIKAQGDMFTLYQLRDDDTFVPQYQFTRQTFQLADFAAMCVYHQTAPESIFTQKQVCTLLTSSGRVTLANGYLIITDVENNEKIKTVIKSEAEYRHLLKTHFEMELPSDVQLNKFIA